MLVYFVLSLVINVSLTGLILWRLLRARSRARRNLGTSHGSVYSQVMRIVVESAAPYALITVIFVILFGVRHPGFVLFFTLYPQLQVRLSFVYLHAGNFAEALQCISSDAIIVLVHFQRRYNSGPELPGSSSFASGIVRRGPLHVTSSQPEQFKLSHMSGPASEDVYSLRK